MIETGMSVGVLRGKCEKLLQLLDRNTKGGPPCDQDTGECYFCEYGIVTDPDEWGHTEMESPSFHKPECPWRQAREFVEQELAR